MLSHLRFHRRGPSNPTSPCPDQTPTSPPSSTQPSPFPHDAISPDGRPASSSSSAFPPTLPPITRVTSAETEPLLDPRRDGDMAHQGESRQQHLPRSPYNGGDSGFIGGVALRKYQQNQQAQAAESMENLRGLGIDGHYSTSRPSLAPINTSAPQRPSPQVLKNTKPTTSFSTPTDLQNSTAGPTGRRPAGTRLVTEPPMLTQTTSNVEVHKAKKGLPFLKNPMSTLLMRRKNSQHVPDLLPLPIKSKNEEPMYDPRIKGTRFHDFSAPRRKKTVNNRPVAHPEHEQLPNAMTAPIPNSASFPTLQPRHQSNASGSLHSSTSQPIQHTPSIMSNKTRGSSAEVGSPSSQNAPPVPPKDDAPVPVPPKPSQVSRLIQDEDSGLPTSSGSTRTTRSRQASLSSVYGKDTPSALPRHMKSTSSRFSFDMIGAAKQEKILEDRHRQREAEKKTAVSPVQRDSRFDDFDDDFDYDAMMDDDGLEERIPGVNADYEDDGYLEEEINMVGDDDIGVDIPTDLQDPDPDNDQENFSGFVFQRSNPTSELASPKSAGFLATPRDANGTAIGFAMSKDSPGLLAPSLQTPSLLPDHLQLSSDGSAGLGIQGLDVSSPSSMAENEIAFQQNQQLPRANVPLNLNEDDLYFDNGMVGFENEFAEDLAEPPEWDDTPFDESIFDNNDTDQYGRPIPGAFAQAQSQRRATTQETGKRESDITSRFSAHSAVSQSTTHTSVSVDNQKPAQKDDQKETPQELAHEESSKLPTPSEETVVAYQAALAAAAHKAAASGKFQRSSSPPMDAISASKADRSPSTPDLGDSYRDDDYDDYGYSYEDMADFDLDDDAIIAEANASALANDSDGWYGQEFGFYSAPVQQQQPQHGARDANPDSVDYEYANGGFFGPKGGLNRTISGRMVSREPNLTPITERSEYSNRNSIMSMGLPGFGPGTPLQSPGLAQLALLGDRGDEMTLSALLRLRSKAWGGSQASLVSSREGSPRSELGDLPSSPWGPNFFSPTATHARKNSMISAFTAESEGGSIAGSPTLTMAGIQNFTPPPPLPSTSQEDMKLSTTDGPLLPHQLETTISPISDSVDTPLSATGISPLESSKSPDSAISSGMPSRRSAMGHRHKGSADSISYTKEEDSGATRWVMERRRTGESGQEILEREIVEGGRI
ncbi:Fc.00g030200.m01.CDS01 [Cosmosporella sp. VM-42]